MSISPHRQGRRVRAHRRGFTMKESIAVIVIIIVVLAIAFPSITMFRERARRLECESHLSKIGKAIDQFTSIDSAHMLPTGSKYDTSTRSSGTSWWVDILPYAEVQKSTHRWVPHNDSGDFSLARAPNSNMKFADGYHLPLFYCASSPLPQYNDPDRHVAEINRKQIEGRAPRGIPVPMYAAVAGSAPDMLDYTATNGFDRSFGRNTNEGPWGILSASGMFPPNKRMRQSAALDQKDKTILLVEQSDYARDDTLEPASLYDVRNSWPKGAFMGATGDYGDISPAAQNLNGDGSQRCWNITSVRYPINTRDIKGKKGIFTDPAAPSPEAGETNLPPYPDEGYGPGHNNPIISSHPGGANVLMMDGNVQFLNEKMDLGILLQMSTRDDKHNIE